MKLAFWVLCALIAYAYVGYPLTIWLLSRLAGRDHSRDEEFAPSMTLLVPAYNEEAIIASKLDNALSLDYPRDRLQIIVASESDDATDAIVRGYADRGVILVTSSVRRGKVANLGRAIPGATGEILVFTDANALFAPDCLRKLARHFADPSVGSVSGRLVYAGAGGASASAERTYWSFEMMVKRASSRLGSLPGANGSLFALRRALYRPISERRGDDFELPIRVILQGYRSVLEPEAVSTEEPSSRYIDEYRRKARIINWMVVSALILLKEAIAGGRWLIAFQLLFHKLNRWAVPIWLILLFPVTLRVAGDGGIYAAALAGQILLYALALAGLVLSALGRKPPALLGLPLYFVVVNAASLVGTATALAGHEVRWHKRPGGIS